MMGKLSIMVFVLTKEQCGFYYQNLFNEIPWEHDQAIVFGKHYTTKRKVAWFGDEEYSYKYSGVVKQAHIWTKELLELKKIVEEISGSTYNSLFVKFISYRGGGNGMA